MEEGEPQVVANLSSEMDSFRATLLRGQSLGILLYLAKHNPHVTIDDIKTKFGENSLNGLRELEIFNLVIERKEKLYLTDEGIFQVDALLATLD